MGTFEEQLVLIKAIETYYKKKVKAFAFKKALTNDKAIMEVTFSK
jgi:putative transposon-encoded protein